MTILVAEDEPVSRRVLESMLTAWGYRVVLAGNGAEAWRMLSSAGPPRIAILDWMMPGMDGVEVCRRLRALKREPYVYILMLTARNSPGDVAAGLEAGADDYLTKPLDANELKVRVRAGERLLELQAELREAREALCAPAQRDPATGVWQREAIRAILEREVGRALRQSTPLAIALATLDAEGGTGVQPGEEILREFGRHLATGVQTYDAVGGWGGGRFLLVLPGCDEDSGRHQCECLAVSPSTSPAGADGNGLRFTARFGVAALDSGEEHTPESLLRRAEAALAAAAGRGAGK